MIFNYSILVFMLHLFYSDFVISKITETCWRSWSKVGELTIALLQSGIFPNCIHFLKLVAPKNFSYFMYCVLIAVDLPLQKDEVKCLNVVQEVRGKIVPGYLTLFQRCTSIRCHLKTTILLYI